VSVVHIQDVVRTVAWCPNAKLSLIAIASGQGMLLTNSKVSDKLLIKKTDDILMEAPKTDLTDDERVKTAVEWQT
jgi:ribosome biogenesis protein ERB1